jgi:copper(I)-binding protein
MSQLFRLLVVFFVFGITTACTPHKEADSHTHHTSHGHSEQPAISVDMSTLPEGITFADARVRAAFAGATTGAAYITINNNLAVDAHLISVSVSEDVAMSVEIHDMRMNGDMLQMFQLDNGVTIPAKTQLQLRPGGKHIMFMGLATELNEGKTIDLTFEFAKQPPQTISVPVVKL